MSDNTTNLGLYKANPSVDGDNTFNIKTMLNDNWDKIDAAVIAKLLEAKGYTDNKIQTLLNNAPGALDTLKELADALGDDPNFATTITNYITSINAQLSDLTKIPGAIDDTGSANIYVITLATAPTAYSKYQTFKFISKTSNTGASTLNVNGLGAKALVKDVNIPLSTGDILVGQIITAIYDGTNFQVVPDCASHINETIYHTQQVTRNISLTGVQRITVPFKAKNIRIYAVVQDTSKLSVAEWSETGAYGGFIYYNGVFKYSQSNGVWIYDSTFNISATISNVTATGFDLTWTIVSGTPTGTATFYVTCSTH